MPTSSLNQVRLIQSRLQALGYQPGPIDGDYGSRTETAVRQFQAANGLKVDGIVGDRTWSALMAGKAIELPPAVVEEQHDALRAQLPNILQGSRRDVLEAAIDTVGWRETPDGSNGGPEVGRIADGYYPAGEGNPPWCALAVSYWLKVGLKTRTYSATPLGRRVGAVSQLERWGRREGRYTSARRRGGDGELAGVIFTMSRTGSGSDLHGNTNAGHTGLVLRSEGPFFFTVEGNTGNAVASRKRRWSTARAVISWW